MGRKETEEAIADSRAGRFRAHSVDDLARLAALLDEAGR